ncbi:MarR family transcriptional regulator [Methylophilaceae bacterium Uisw_097]|jgi:DNA-binding MarR family transcriptional regulator|tara:strand:- start:23 stop:499 length:477 start_codon:yes stop_codon:yes gene_type:complete
MHKYPNLLLDNQLCFALYSATNAVTRFYRFYFKELDITYSQYLVLITLWEGDCKNITDIAKILKLDLPTITPILKKLETKKLIKKSRSKQDERIILIKLTKKGIDLEDEVAKIQHKVACQTHLNPEEFNLLKNSLNDLTDAMTINDADKEDLKLNQCK